MLISAFIGGLITYLVALWQIRKNRIEHFTINSYEVGKGLSNVFKDFHLEYQNNKLIDNVMVLKGGFINTRKDIEKEIQFDLILPKGCNVKDVKITSKSNSNLEIKTDHPVFDKKNNVEKENIVRFTITNHKFLKNNYFEYSVIVETKEDISDLSKEIEFDHYLTHTTKIKNYNIRQRDKSNKRKVNDILIATELAMFLFAGLLFILLSQLTPVGHKTIENKSNKEVSIYVKDSKLCVYESKQFPFFNNHYIVITPEELYADYRIKYNIDDDNDLVFHWVLLISGCMFTLMFFIMVGVFIFNERTRIERIVLKGDASSN